MATHRDQGSPHATALTGEEVQQAVADRWTAFRTARAELAAVMSDDELRELGIAVDVLDEEP